MLSPACLSFKNCNKAVWPEGGNKRQKIPTCGERKGDVDPCLSPRTVFPALLSGEQVTPAEERTRQPVALRLNLNRMSSVDSAAHMVSIAHAPRLHTPVSQQG